MNRTAAVARLLNGEIVQDDSMYLRIKDGKLQINATVNGLDSGWVRWANGFDYLSSPNLRVVEPKSKIEEAIEREVKVFWNNEKAETMYSMDTKSMLRRVVNLALDEAADTLQSLADDGYVAKAVFEISKLKVKE